MQCLKWLAALGVGLHGLGATAAGMQEGGETVAARESEGEDAGLLELAARCGTEIPWEKSWEKAAARADDEGRMVFVYLRLYPGFQLSDEMMVGPFMDPALIDLLRERFVCWRYVRGQQVPFEDQHSYGLGPNSFGTSFLVVTPDGEVVGDSAATNVHALFFFLCRQLELHPELDAAATPPEGLDDVALAQWYLSRGEFGQAYDVLEPPSSVEQYRLRVLQHLRQRDGEMAWSELVKARALAAMDQLFDIEIDESVTHLRMGHFPAALRLIETALAREPDHDRAPEAMYWAGALKLRTGDKAGAQSRWRELANAHPENRWAWKAAGMLTGSLLAAGLGERLDWPDPRSIEMTIVPAWDPLDPSKCSKAVDDAVHQLVASQDAAGCWSSGIVVDHSVEKVDDFTLAITALCSRALVPYRGLDGVAESITAALRFLSRHGRPKDAPVFVMDYTVWSHACILGALAAAVEAGIVERSRVKDQARELIESLKSRQKPEGGWSYYVSSSISESATPAPQSISFVTATLASLLLDAGEAGLEVPPKMIAAALDCLQAMKHEDGSFEYMLVPKVGEGLRGGTSPESAGRGPLCMLALYRDGRESIAGVRQALDRFVEHRLIFLKEHGKSVMHAGAYGQGSHYLMLDYAYAAAATLALGPQERAPYREALLHQVLSARTKDGTFLDNPILGLNCGTALALIALTHLDKPSEPEREQH